MYSWPALSETWVLGSCPLCSTLSPSLHNEYTLYYTQSLLTTLLSQLFITRVLFTSVRAGMMRYSVPVCKPLGDEGETCRPRGGDLDVPQNTTVYYPDGTSADLNVHMVMCPCAAGLECTGMTCTGLDGAGKLVLREDYTDVDELNQLRRRR